jgi:hypothetical protein
MTHHAIDHGERTRRLTECEAGIATFKQTAARGPFATPANLYDLLAILLPAPP